MNGDVDPDVFAEQSALLSDRLCGALGGQHPAVQGAALADCVATWLAGHIVDGDPRESDTMRLRLFADWIGTVKQLLPVNVAAIHGTPGP